jgi:hypothetical protein
MKSVVFWDIRTQFVLQRRHITSPQQSPVGKCYVRFEVFRAVTVKNVDFWDINTTSYLTVDILRLPYRVQPINAIYDLRFDGGNYEESRLLEYKTPVRTSQERHYFSPTESSW